MVMNSNILIVAGLTEPIAYVGGGVLLAALIAALPSSAGDAPNSGYKGQLFKRPWLRVDWSLTQGSLRGWR
jgi:hypothetical protein